MRAISDADLRSVNATAIAALEIFLLVAVAVVARFEEFVALIGTVEFLIALQVDVNTLIIFACELLFRTRCCCRPNWYR